jgi:hypothetical protein
VASDDVVQEGSGMYDQIRTIATARVILACSIEMSLAGMGGASSQGDCPLYNTGDGVLTRSVETVDAADETDADGISMSIRNASHASMTILDPSAKQSTTFLRVQRVSNHVRHHLQWCAHLSKCMLRPLHPTSIMDEDTSLFASCLKSH